MDFKLSDEQKMIKANMKFAQKYVSQSPRNRRERTLSRRLKLLGKGLWVCHFQRSMVELGRTT